MALIYVDGPQEEILVLDAPDFLAAVTLISEVPDQSMVVFDTGKNSHVAVRKEKLIMFVQGENHPNLSTASVPEKMRQKRVRSKKLQKQDSE